jgi:hypothetical protein
MTSSGPEMRNIGAAKTGNRIGNGQERFPEELESVM